MRRQSPARAIRNEKVRGSNPLSSTKPVGQRPARILNSGAGSGKSAETQNFATWPMARRTVTGVGERRRLAGRASSQLYGEDDHSPPRGSASRIR